MIYYGRLYKLKISDVDHLIRNLRPIYFEKLQEGTKKVDLEAFFLACFILWAFIRWGRRDKKLCVNLCEKMFLKSAKAA